LLKYLGFATVTEVISTDRKVVAIIFRGTRISAEGSEEVLRHVPHIDLLFKILMTLIVSF